MSRSTFLLPLVLALAYLTGCGHLTEVYVVVPEQLEGLTAQRVDSLERLTAHGGSSVRLVSTRDSSRAASPGPTAGEASSSDSDSSGAISGGSSTPGGDASASTASAESVPVGRYVAQLGGNDPVHPVQTQATGRAVFTLRETPSGRTLDFRLEVERIENVLMAHIHVAPSGNHGPVVAWLYPTDPPDALLADPFSIGNHPETARELLVTGPFSGVLSQGTITEDDLVGQLEGRSLDALTQHLASGEAVVNVHTRQNVMGEVWGEIRFAR